MENEASDKRIFPRKPIRDRGEIVEALSGAKHPIDLLDVSEGGISFLSDTPTQKDSMLLVRFELDGRVVRGVVRIVYCVKHSLADAYRLGAAFKNLEEKYQRNIRLYLERG